MPKKFSGENSKAVAAKERKDAAKSAELQKKKAQEEDEYWRDDDKKVVKKQQKKDDMEKKKQEQLEKKAMLRALEEQETEQIKKESGAKQTASKITRAQILAENEKREAAARQAVVGSTPTKSIETHLTSPLPENINKLIPEGVEARTVDEAIAVLSIENAPSDKHPEKRMKAAYTAFEEKNLSRLKQENPNMRLSQIKQLLHKEWLKSPENPFNQKI